MSNLKTLIYVVFYSALVFYGIILEVAGGIFTIKSIVVSAAIFIALLTLAIVSVKAKNK